MVWVVITLLNNYANTMLIVWILRLKCADLVQGEG
jgi:hypothetical protein